VPGPAKNPAAVSFGDFRTDCFPHPGHIPRIARVDIRFVHFYNPLVASL
jgi:hypothetical protein